MTRLAFLYLGRRGALSRFTHAAMIAAGDVADLEASVIVSRQNEQAALFADLGSRAILVDTFQSHAGALFGAWRILRLRRRLTAELRRRRITTVIELMPHVWSFLLADAIRQGGARYLTVVHDAEPHPGDATARLQPLLRRAAVRADHVVTLSGAVTDRLLAQGRLSPDRLTTLFLPDLDYGGPRIGPTGNGPLRVLFLGRIMPYKGLSLFVDALERLQASGIAVRAGVFGEGELGAEAARLRRLGAEVVNRWLIEDEIAGVLARYDVMVVAHVEASQSGVVATAFGAGLPVVATPVGGLPEQVHDGVSGLVLPTVSATALSEAITRLASDRNLLATLRDGVAAQRENRSMRRFVEACRELARQRP